jgi:hypothetical protein
MICLYAIVPARRSAIRVNGLRNEPLTLVPAGRVSGVVGRLATVPAPTPRNLRAYHDAIARLAGVVPALLPVRFGTTFQSPADVVALLRARGASFTAALVRVRRRVQMTVRFVPGGDSRPAEEPPMPDAAGSSGTAYLRWRASASRPLAAWTPYRELTRVVRPWIKAEAIDERQGVMSIYHLIPRAAAERYRRAVEGGTFSARVTVAGPFAPFAFADPLAGSAAAPARSPADAPASPPAPTVRSRAARRTTGDPLPAGPGTGRGRG